MDRSPADSPLDLNSVEPIAAAPEVLINLDESAPAASPAPPASPASPASPARRRSRALAAAWPARPMMGRRTATARALVMLALALAVGLPRATPPTPTVQGRTVPLPSYCTGTPIPGGRLNIVQNDTFIILDATTGTVINSGPCPHGTGTRSNTGN
ncbi:hypothetical protein [Dactylosporangium sp. CS-033363]|uniref:hypothetical protein n=1 Tax=Dactylosporangium sp. CS-033363 TaxID=3239935 RepID=UPI003D9425E8